MPHSTELERPLEALETSQTITTVHLSTPSPDGQHFAALTSPTTLTIYAIPSLEPVLTINIPASTTPAKQLTLSWSPLTSTSSTSNRILLASPDTIRIYDITDPAWSAVISSGSSSAGCNSSVEFGCDDGQVVVFSEFAAAVTTWCLYTGKNVEIRDPKFPNSRSFARNKPGRKGVLALLSRSASQDTLSLHAASSSALIRSISLSTVDAQGVKWSPDGRWLAVWDTPTLGYKVMIFTSDGHLYRTYCGDYFDDALAGLGVRTIEWSPSGGCLAIGGYEKRITLLSTTTFSPAIYLYHAVSANPSRCPVYRETDSTYTCATSTITPPTTSTLSTTPPPQSPATTHLQFCPSSSLLASVNSQTPSTVFIWDLTVLSLRAILVQHADIKRLTWHPNRSGLLLIRTATQDGKAGLYTWDAEDAIPHVLRVPAQESRSSLNNGVAGRTDATWLSSSGENPAILFATSTSSTILYPFGAPTFNSPMPVRAKADAQSYSNGTAANITITNASHSASSSHPSPTPSHSPESKDVGTEDEDEDSLYEILTGKSSHSRPQPDSAVVNGTDAHTSLKLDAAFDESAPAGMRGDAAAAGSRDDDTFQHLRANRGVRAA